MKKKNLFIRVNDEELKQDAKIDAARDGVTLIEWWEDAARKKLARRKPVK